jgi:Flp pilus assembly protein TadG
MKRRGAVTALTTVLMGVMICFEALALDIGYIAFVRAQAQNCADAAALAAAAKMVQDDRLRGYLTTVTDQARDEAVKFAALNRIGTTDHPVVQLNRCNAAGGDILIGRLENTANLDEPLNLNATTSFNAVQVTVRCTAERGQQLPFFFARIMGLNTFDMQATATAIFDDRSQGFRTPSSGQQCSLLPFAVNRADWIDQIVHDGGTDDWTYDNGGNVVAGPDGIRELNMYPDRLDRYGNPVGAGNFGTVDIGNLNNSTPDLRRQILEGPNANDLAVYGGALELSPDTGSLQLNGDTGISTGIADVIEQILGRPRTVFLYDTYQYNGNNTDFHIVGFAGIRVVDFRLTGNNKYILVQPAYVPDATAIPGTVGESYYVGQPVHLAR